MILTDADRATLEALLVAIDEATELWPQLERDMREMRNRQPERSARAATLRRRVLLMTRQRARRRPVSVSSSDLGRQPAPLPAVTVLGGLQRVHGASLVGAGGTVARGEQKEGGVGWR
jgi:hypothetical protein